MTQASELQLGQDHRLSAQQIAYFNTFGFLHVPGLFSDEIEEITAAYERIFADPQNEKWELRDEIHHGGDLRLILLSIIDKDPVLQRLRDDPRIVGAVASLIGEDYEFVGSDGNKWYCETFWHSDVFGSPLSTYHVKLSLYLDSTNGQTGAIRLIPGTQFYTSTFAETLRQDLLNHQAIKDVFGVEGREIPSWTIENEPGDLIVWNQRVIHASYNRADGRRAFALNFKERD